MNNCFTVYLLSFKSKINFKLIGWFKVNYLLKLLSFKKKINALYQEDILFSNAALNITGVVTFFKPVKTIV